MDLSPRNRPGGVRLFSAAAVCFALLLGFLACDDDTDNVASVEPFGSLRVRMDLQADIPSAASGAAEGLVLEAASAAVDSVRVAVLDAKSRESVASAVVAAKAGVTRYTVHVVVPASTDLVVAAAAEGRPADSGCGSSVAGATHVGLSATVRVEPEGTSDVALALLDFVPRVEVSSVVGSVVNLAWAAVPGAQEYLVRRFDDECNVTEEAVGATSATVDLDEPLAAGKALAQGIVRVAARNDAATGSASDPVNLAALPLCLVDPPSLEFGGLSVGGSNVMSFTITNAGGGSLRGNVVLDCEGFEILEGEGPFDLPAAASRTVTVLFNPSAAGGYGCSVATGTGCASVDLSGNASLAPVCSIDRSALNFGSVRVGDAAEQSFRITNTGGGSLQGSVAEPSCGHFEIVSGAGDYLLTAGQFRDVVVGYAPESAGSHSCSITTGGRCGSVPARGSGFIPAACEIDKTDLDFGSVILGSYKDMIFRISNTGGRALSGAIEATCPHFRIISGGGAFDLAGGASRSVKIRFEPASAGDHACTVTTGGLCADVLATGRGEIRSICLVDASELDFGSLLVGETKDLSFQITNTGGAVLAAAASLNCDHFSIVSGGGSFDLSPEESRTVTVRYAPTQTGDHACDLFTGTRCQDVKVRGRAEVPPTCSVDRSEIDFGTILLGESRVLSFSIRNAGGRTLAGAVAADCEHFEIASGGGSYALASGQARTVQVRFAPAVLGEHICSISTGAGCPAVTAVGTADPQALCSVDAEILDFGDVVVGDTKDLSVTIRNAGGGVLSGTVLLSCRHYSIIEGRGTYTLAPSASRRVTVRFHPLESGDHTCDLRLGSSCGDLLVTGRAFIPSRCLVDETYLDFGTLVVGQSRTRSFTITNRGEDPLVGSVNSSCDHFEIVAGGGGYDLPEGASREVSVRFHPDAEGDHACTIDTGTGCADVTAAGRATTAGQCTLDVADLDFGNLTVGGVKDLSFTITNTGGSVLRGDVTSDCSHFSVEAGSGVFELYPGGIRTVTVRYRPTSDGAHSCAIDTGSECGEVSAFGSAGQGPRGSIDHTYLNFENVPVYFYSELGFVLKNTGPVPLIGSIEESCPNFELIAGGGAYDLAPGASKSVTARFEPRSPGSYSCFVTTGDYSPGVTLFGIGDAESDCGVAPEDLQFGDVPVGFSDTKIFTVTNEGPSTFTGEVKENCADFEVISGAGRYTLGPGESHVVVIQFTPSIPGFQMCIISTAKACSAIAASGTGINTPLCDLDTESLDFGTVDVGSSASLPFTITNEGGGSLSGTVEFDGACPDFAFLSGGGPYSLGHGESRTVVVEFAPLDDGPVSCTVLTGSDCPTVEVEGAGDEEEVPECAIEPEIVDFGEVNVAPLDFKTYAEESFTITNTGSGVLSGFVESVGACHFFTIFSGGGAFSLGEGEEHTVVVRYKPFELGVHSCTITTGLDICPLVGVIGEGISPAVPFVEEEEGP